jgi:Hg(II)-responsive transcriptional regulator
MNTIGDLARETGVNIETVRYYERRGLLPKAARSPSNYRLYDTDAKRRVNFIKRAQSLGFSLREINTLLSLQATPRAKCEDVRAYAEAKTQEIDNKIRSLKAMQKALRSLIAECSGKAPITQCPILDSLESDNS